MTAERNGALPFTSPTVVLAPGYALTKTVIAPGSKAKVIFHYSIFSHFYFFV